MALIDRQYLARPYYGSRRMAGVAGKPRATRSTAKRGPATNAADRAGGGLFSGRTRASRRPAHKVYPYLLGGLSIDRVNQVLVLGHHLYPDGQGVRVSGRDHGLAQSCGTGLAAVEHARRRFSASRRSRKALASLWSAGDLQHRPEPAPAKAGGSQFTSDDFTGVLSRHEVTISMDGKGRCMDKRPLSSGCGAVSNTRRFTCMPMAPSPRLRPASGLGWFSTNEERQHQSHGYRTPRQVYEAQCRWICGRSALPTGCASPASRASSKKRGSARLRPHPPPAQTTNTRI